MHNTQVQELADAIGDGAQLVVVDPRFSVAASKARYWLPIKPGTDTALLLAWINVLIAEGLYDKAYIQKWTVGFDQLAAHVKTFTPEWAAPITDLPAEQIRESAREMGRNRPQSVIVPGRHVTWYGNDTQRSRAVSHLERAARLVGTPGRLLRAGAARTPQLPRAGLRPPRAERPIFWTRQQLENSPDSPEQTRRRWDFLLDMPRLKNEAPYLFVHGWARNPLNEYEFPEDINNPRKMERIYGLITQYCFQGHTHVPGVFTASGSFHRPSDLSYRYRLGPEKLMINVGSVGQPRDGDSRLCYVIYDEESGKVQFVREEYDIEAATRKILEAGLPPYLAQRLLVGQ